MSPPALLALRQPKCRSGCCCPSAILGIRYRLQVARVDAEGVQAEVIKNKATGDRAYREDVSDSMGEVLNVAVFL
jgi:hypothetical protein